MSETGTDTVPAVHAVPPSLWALGWSSVAGQVLVLAERGPQDPSRWAGSVLLGVVLVPLIVHGVVRARPIRFWFVVVLLCLAPLFGIIGLVVDPSWWDAVVVGLGMVQLALMRDYHASEWFAWQRTRPSTGPSIVPILLVAVLVGALGGVIGAPSDGPGVNTHVSV